MKTVDITRRTELGKMPAGSLSLIVDILEINEDWKKFVPLIPKTPYSQERKYNCEEILTMETCAKETKRKFADVLFDEWGTSGEERPTLGFLMELLQEAKMIRAVEEIARMLGEPPPPRPTHGPFAPIATNLTDIFNEMSMKLRLYSEGTTPNLDINNASRDDVPCANTPEQENEEIVTPVQNTGLPAEIDHNVPSTSTSNGRPALTQMLKTPYDNQQSSSSFDESSNYTESNTTLDSSSRNQLTENDSYELMGDLYVCEEVEIDI